MPLTEQHYDNLFTGSLESKKAAYNAPWYVSPAVLGQWFYAAYYKDANFKTDKVNKKKMITDDMQQIVYISLLCKTDLNDFQARWCIVQ